MNYTVRKINPQTDPRWDDFVTQHPSGRIYHSSAWARVIQATYGHTPFYLALEDPGSGELKGAAPFFIVKSRLTGERVTSLPFAAYCNPLISLDSMAAMLSFIFSHVPRARYIKLKLLDFNLNGLTPNVQVISDYVTHLIDLRKPLDQLFRSFHVSSVRQRIRRAERNGITFRVSESTDDLRSFYRLFRAVRQNHGLPPHPLAFFENMWSNLKPAGLLKLAVVEHEKRMIAGAIVLKSNAAYHFEYSASCKNSWKLCPNQKLLWEIIKMAHADNAHCLDLGRSTLNHQSLVDYKERWQAEQRGLAYCILPVAGHPPPAAAGDTDAKRLLRRCLESVNHHIPGRLLEWEGRAIYPHVD